jgi:hypothetical protein
VINYSRLLKRQAQLESTNDLTSRIRDVLDDLAVDPGFSVLPDFVLTEPGQLALMIARSCGDMCDASALRHALTEKFHSRQDLFGSMPSNVADDQVRSALDEVISEALEQVHSREAGVGGASDEIAGDVVGVPDQGMRGSHGDAMNRMSMVRVASKAAALAQGYTAVGSGIYKKGHHLWQFRTAEEQDGGSFVLVRMYEDPDPTIERQAKTAAPQRWTQRDMVKQIRPEDMAEASRKPALSYSEEQSTADELAKKRRQERNKGQNPLRDERPSWLTADSDGESEYENEEVEEARSFLAARRRQMVAATLTPGATVTSTTGFHPEFMDEYGVYIPPNQQFRVDGAHRAQDDMYYVPLGENKQPMQLGLVTNDRNSHANQRIRLVPMDPRVQHITFFVSQDEFAHNFEDPKQQAPERSDTMPDRPSNMSALQQPDWGSETMEPVDPNDVYGGPTRIQNTQLTPSNRKQGQAVRWQRLIGDSQYEWMVGNNRLYLRQRGVPGSVGQITRAQIKGKIPQDLVPKLRKILEEHSR